MRALFLLFFSALLFPSTVAAAPQHPFETAMYVTIYSKDNALWGMTPANPQYEAYRDSDLDAILSRIKADGFDTVYFLPGQQLGRRAPWKTDLPFLQTAEEWTQAGRDITEELLTAADRNKQRVYLCVLRIIRNDPEWWGKVFSNERWHDEKGRRVNALLAQARKVAIPAMQEIVRKYGHHPSLVGFGTDEVAYGGDLFGTGLNADAIGYETIERYKKQYGEDPPSMDPLPETLTEKMDRLLAVREAVMTEYHKLLGDACKARGMEYTTTLNASMLGKARWTGLGGEKAVQGTDIWQIGNLDGVSEVATDFYASRLSSHIQADITKFYTSPLYGKPINMVIGTQDGVDVLAKHLIDTLAEGVDRITYWTNVYYYGDTRNKKALKTPADPDRISYLVKAAEEFRERVPVRPQYDVAIFLSRAWQRDHYRTEDPGRNEICQMGHAVDALNMGGYRYDILCDDEAAAGGLKGIPAAVVPLGIGLTESGLSTLERFVKDGGLLVTFGDFGSSTPWGDPAPSDCARRVKALLASERVVHLPRLLGDHSESRLPVILSKNGIHPSSPLTSDVGDLAMRSSDYDPYWGPRPKFPVNGKIYDLFWSGDRYQAVSIGHRSNREGKTYRMGRCSARLRPYQNMVAGRTSEAAEDYDLFLINNDQRVEVAARKVFVFGRDGRWAEHRAQQGQQSVLLKGPVLIRIP